jgi:hypothetical protein
MSFADVSFFSVSIAFVEKGIGDEVLHLHFGVNRFDSGLVSACAGGAGSRRLATEDGLRGRRLHEGGGW